jgi:hypothetical protein
MLVRLILAREMIGRANAIIDALENPTSGAAPGDTFVFTRLITSACIEP